MVYQSQKEPMKQNQRLQYIEDKIEEKQSSIITPYQSPSKSPLSQKMLDISG